MRLRSLEGHVCRSEMHLVCPEGECLGANGTITVSAGPRTRRFTGQVARTRLLLRYPMRNEKWKWGKVGKAAESRPFQHLSSLCTQSQEARSSHPIHRDMNDKQWGDTSTAYMQQKDKSSFWSRAKLGVRAQKEPLGSIRCRHQSEAIRAELSCRPACFISLTRLIRQMNIWARAAGREELKRDAGLRDAPTLWEHGRVSMGDMTDSLLPTAWKRVNAG